MATIRPRRLPDQPQGNASAILAGKRIVLGVCGGIAAYKSVEILRLLSKQGAQVSCVLTDSATQFVGQATFAALSDAPPVVGNLWSHPDPSPHTTLGRNADVVVVAPATARLVSDLASGRSADALTATLLATTAPVFICPAMHTEMWQHPAVQANIETLRSRGVHIVDPEVGALAGGDFGEGRLAQPQTVVDATIDVLVPRASTLEAKRVVVTAGGTREPLDAVRFLGNRSSGKQGHAIANAAVDRGAEVVLITTQPHPERVGLQVVRVETAEDMRSALALHANNANLVVMAAAVADFRPKNPGPSKLKKQDGVPLFELEATPDLLTELAATRVADRLVVGFAAETDNVIDNGRSKLDKKNLDLIVINDVSADNVGFDHSTNEVTIIDRKGNEYTTGLVDKRTVAEMLLDQVERLMGVE